MTIEFRCPSCNQQLRVPDESVGKNARCPKCQAIVPVPAGSPPAAPVAPAAPFGSHPSVPPAPVPPFGAPAGPPVPAPPPSPFGAAPGTPGNPFAGPSTPAPVNPFANPPGPTAGGFGAPPPKPNPFAAEGPVNPYASPAVLSQPVSPQDGAVGHQIVGLDPILNYAMQIWKANLGLLVGVTATVLAANYGFAFVIGFIQAILEANHADPKMAALMVITINLISSVVQIFLGIGHAQINLKLARQQPAQYTDLFNGGSRFLPVFGASILAGIALFAGALLCVVPAIVMALFCWPFYYLVVENRCSVMESFSLAARITEGNRATTFLVWLVSMGIGILGFLALCIGVIFALPLVYLLSATAYLMMSGQLPLQPYVAKQTP